VAGLLLSAVLAGGIDRHRPAAASVPQYVAAARRSSANVGSVMLIAELMRLNADFL